jgi:hypothetical protein
MIQSMVGYHYLEEVGFVLGVVTFFLPNVDERFLVAYSLDFPCQV